eukprot:CAMPEP_0167776196 /NCGR_PEP_ID=MMETSP0111_2-20121227/2991_1 /TAXON_ID=91324 /ORGANISM="Lotharella globosa, Strain CCCM811" /LENGTH=638 /DNA_ID=CAMNT_0007666217 /DNA_START=276 /DNA_END=2188 /DNA_ORIENTATION=+
MHANFHACFQSDGVCSPLYYGASTEASIFKSSQPPTAKNLTNITWGTAEFWGHGYQFDRGQWNGVAHIKFTTGGNTTHPEHLYDVTLGFPFVVDDVASYLGDPAEIFIIAIAGIVYLYLAFLIVVAVRERNSSMMRHSVFWLTMVHLVGAAVFVTTVFFWNLEMNGTRCKLAIGFVSVGFSLFFTPLLIKACEFFVCKEERIRIGNSSSQKSRMTGIERQKIAITVTCFVVVLGLDVLLIPIWFTIYPPTSQEHVWDDPYRDTCEMSFESEAMAVFVFTIKAALVAIATFMIWFSKRDGIAKHALERYRVSITGVAVSGLVAMIIQVAFSSDVLTFLIRSIGILAAAFFGTSWLYLAWQETRLLLKVQRRGNLIEESTAATPSVTITANSVTELAPDNSTKTFYALFTSPIIRGYLYNLMAKSLDQESIEFCNAVYEYKANVSVEGAKYVIDNYVDADAENCVNVSADMRERVQRKFGEITQKIAEAKSMDEKPPPEPVACEKDVKDEEKHLKASSSVSSPSSSIPPHIRKELKNLFERPFKEVRRLIYMNNWKPFRESDYGLSAATWLEWLEYMDGFSVEEQSWVSDHIRLHIRQLLGQTTKMSIRPANSSNPQATAAQSNKLKSKSTMAGATMAGT